MDSHDDLLSYAQEYDCYHRCPMHGGEWHHVATGTCDRSDTPISPDICDNCIADNTCPNCDDFPATVAERTVYNGVDWTSTILICCKCKAEI